MADERELAEIERLLGLCEVQAVRSGVPLPLGAQRRGNGTNFALFSRHATGVRLDLFAGRDDVAPARTIILDPARNKTGDIWHVWLEGVGPGQHYGYRVAGPNAPEQGHRFDPERLLVDPYATAIALIPGVDFSAARGRGPSEHAAAKSVVGHLDFDWRGDRPLRIPWTQTVIYELHVRGYTIDPSAEVRHAGTYRGLLEKLPHLRALGVTAVELMPVTEFNEHECHAVDPHSGERLRNFWGYDPIGFFAPKASYASARDPRAALLELKDMVRGFHEEGIEVILDLVLNHTVEGDARGPTVGLRGIDNAIYYWLGDDPREYRDFTGTGHTVHASHPVVRDLILDVLRYWVIEAHVDGFRFDLASVLGRDAQGRLLADAPLLERIAEDPILRDTKLIAEAWDVAGAYQVGSFSTHRWAEWNGRFRDDVRRFWRGDAGMLGRFASRIAGSADIYEGSGKGPESSINFVTCHDGLTLADLVSYAHKHNAANGEGDRDGTEQNWSDHYGVEGRSDDPELEAVRARQCANFLVTLAVSRGVPMLLGGDELGRTQHGNNNAWCQDNPTSWVDWSGLADDGRRFRFTRDVFALRRRHRVLRREAFYGERDVAWHAPDGTMPRWDDAEARELLCLLRDPGHGAVCLVFNASRRAVTFELPPCPGGGHWHLAIDTGLPPPRDVVADERELVPLSDTRKTLVPRSCAMLVER